MRASSLSELLSLSATKKYTDSRIRRGILFALTDVLQADLCEKPAYVRVLAANPVGCALLAKKRKTASIPLVTRQAEIPTDPAACRQEELHRRAVALYTLCLEKPLAADLFLRKNPVIVKEGEKKA